MLSKEESIKAALSVPRLSTYEAATFRVPLLPRLADAVELYAWNAQVSAALLAPLHICEVVIRNAVSDALERVYGDRWPWSPGLVRSLPTSAHSFNAKLELINVANRQRTTGKVIPELKFVFWQTLFTSRFEKRIWAPHLRTVLPCLDPSASYPIVTLLGQIYGELEHLRKLRNRIAHHEPIFSRNLAGDFQKIQDLIALRCPLTAAWMTTNQQALALISAKPVPRI